MSTDRDVTRIVRSWLDEGVTQLPDRVLDGVLDQLPATPQRRAGRLARRFPIMNSNIVRFGVAAAAVVLAVIVGINFLPGTNFGGQPEPTPTPSPSPSAATSTEPTPMPLPEEFMLLEPGTHVAGDPFLVPVTFTVPDGWEGRIGGPYLVLTGIVGKPSGLRFAIFDRIAVDPCQGDTGFVDLPPEQSVDDLATALADMPGIEVTDVSDVSVDGYSGTQLTVTAPDSFAGCTLQSDGYVIWQLPLGANFSMTPGERDRVWILDVTGTRLVIVVTEEPGYTDAQRAEFQAVFDSIRIEPAP